MSDYLTEIAHTADELTNPMRSIEPIWDYDHNRNKRIRRVWVVNLPSLLDQLAEAIIPGETYIEDEATRGAFASRPAARLDAVDRLLAIEAGAALWCTRAALNPRDNAHHNVRALVGTSPTLDSDRQRALCADLRAWRTWAATVTGWEHPPHAPRAPCPLCDTRGTLRIRLEKNTGCCMACGSAWDEDNIGLLTEHITVYLHTAATASRTQRAQAVAQRLQHVLPVGWDARPDLPYYRDAPVR